MCFVFSVNMIPAWAKQFMYSFAVPSLLAGLWILLVHRITQLANRTAWYLWYHLWYLYSWLNDYVQTRGRVDYTALGALTCSLGVISDEINMQRCQQLMWEKLISKRYLISQNDLLIITKCLNLSCVPFCLMYKSLAKLIASPVHQLPANTSNSKRTTFKT